MLPLERSHIDIHLPEITSYGIAFGHKGFVTISPLLILELLCLYIEILKFELIKLNVVQHCCFGSFEGRSCWLVGLLGNQCNKLRDLLTSLLVTY